jgi:hypothetical protein
MPFRKEGTNLVTYRLQLFAQGLAMSRHCLTAWEAIERTKMLISWSIKRELLAKPSGENQS